MVEVREGHGRDTASVSLRLHNMLLAFAGRLDDSGLSHARELVARARQDEAIELVTGALTAGRLPVRSAEQRELAALLGSCGSDGALAELLAVDESAGDTTGHRFSGDRHPGQGVDRALEPALQVLPEVRAVHAVWRLTGAGSVSGPLPQRVVLVEVGSEASPPATAYRMASELRRAGVDAAVEVSGPGAEWCAYHRHALAAAVPVWHASRPPAADASLAPAPWRHTPWLPAEQEPEWPSEPEPEVPDTPTRPSTVEVAATAQAEDYPPDNLFVLPSDRSHRREPGAHVLGTAEHATESTAELSTADVRELRTALAGEQRRAADTPSGSTDARLSSRENGLLRQLHAELAKREHTGP
ncbi:hypothetical protein [Haloechinothrix sp. LS1_15]|uniref:hypothetical protein n=1 Tax=Haloechinothrix sp. LS1_15 TaxID=2652248 RepID=UPI0029463974|nr:hypothetical protein [Haloechinothrix sp. LS1_15]MDV6014735.1 hypothetical protein [Haloechinothrix sp. LS1_15]